MTENEFKSLKVGDLLKGTNTGDYYDASWLQIGMFTGIDPASATKHWWIFPIKSTRPDIRKDSNGCTRFGGFDLFERIGDD